MNSWWWVAVGLVAWCGVAVVIGLCIGPVLKRSSRVRESLDQQWAEVSTGHEPALEGQLSTGAADGDGEFVPEPRHAFGPAIARPRDPSTSKRKATMSSSLPAQSLPSMRP